MAIIKSVITPHGVEAQYHKITNVSINTATDTVQLQFAIFATAAARDSGKMPLWNDTVSFKLSELQPDPLALLYPLAMSSEYYTGGVSDAAEVTLANAITRVAPVVVDVEDTTAAQRFEALLRPKPTVGAV